MKINRFFASGVHGCYDFDFTLKQDISFLVGINGSGKTSALQLMKAVLSLDLLSITSIRFKYLSVWVSLDKVDYLLKAVHSKGAVDITLNNEYVAKSFAVLSSDERDVYAGSGRLHEYMEEQRINLLKNSSRVIVKFFEEARPLFLGLERKMGRYDEYSSAIERLQWGAFHGSLMKIKGETVEGLDNCKGLISRAYLNYRKISDASSKKLINVIVESTFDYMELDSSVLVGAQARAEEFSSLLSRRKEIENFSKVLGGGVLAVEKIDTFFSRMNEIATEESTNGTISVEWLMNKAQIKRMHNILAEMDRQKKASEKAYAPIQAFLNSMNDFLRETRKVAEIDSLGELKILHNGNSIPLASLSSGEKQLLILLAHARFAGRKGGVFIVDEPEISLHLRWQEMLVDSLIAGNSQNQFIFATHSPEIIGYRKQNCIRVG